MLPAFYHTSEFLAHAVGVVRGAFPNQLREAHVHLGGGGGQHDDRQDGGVCQVSSTFDCNCTVARQQAAAALCISYF